MPQRTVNALELDEVDRDAPTRRDSAKLSCEIKDHRCFVPAAPVHTIVAVLRTSYAVHGGGFLDNRVHVQAAGLNEMVNET